MPPKKRLPASVVADFRAWIRMGAPDPRDGKAVARAKGEIHFAKAREFWAFKPAAEPKLPRVKNKEWVRSPLDQFILARLEKIGFATAPQADNRTLIRRATYDLTGLPPSLAEINAFLADNSADAFTKIIDRLLASPRYGEKWGRHWLDVARYADSNGLDENLAYINAAEVDRPIAGLLRDLKARGLLEDTLVMWGGEFGRTPVSQSGNGRDHNPHAMTMFFTGAGIKPGIAYGSTDDHGYYAVENKVHYHDVHATLLHLLGLDHTRLTYRYAGRDFRLTDVEGKVVRDILA
jgi:hypothetical protein